jgi:hypothetical protein
MLGVAELRKIEGKPHALICSLIGLNGLSAVKTLPVTVWRFVSFRVFVS